MSARVQHAIYGYQRKLFYYHEHMEQEQRLFNAKVVILIGSKQEIT